MDLLLTWRNSMAIGDISASGELSPARAVYDWEHYTDGTNIPAPRQEERRITLDRNEPFPVVPSSRRKAFWKMVWYKA